MTDRHEPTLDEYAEAFRKLSGSLRVLSESMVRLKAAAEKVTATLDSFGSASRCLRLVKGGRRG